jgi:hypothetical protein
MESFSSFSALLAIQIFWTSILFIGYISFASLNKKFPKLLLGFRGKINLPLRLIFYLMFGVAFFSLVTFIGYCLRLQSWWLGVSYLSVAGISIILAGFYVREELKNGSLNLYGMLKKIRIFSWAGIAILIAGADYLISLKLGSFLGGDGYVHMSKIGHLVSDGFTLTDAYYGTVPETRHHINVLHTLYAIPSYFGINAVDSWFYSLAPLRIAQWITLYGFTAYILNKVNIDKKWHVSIASIAVILSIAVSSRYFTTYPTEMVTSIWIPMFIIGLFELLTNRRSSVFLLSCLIIPMVHPLMSLFLCLLLGITGIFSLIFARKRLFVSLTPIVIGGILLVAAPVFSALLPNQMSDKSYTYGEDTYAMTSIANTKIFTPALSTYSVDGTHGVSSITQYNDWIGIIGFIGLIWLFYLMKSKESRIIIGSLLLAVPILLYIPFIFSLLHEVLPYWALWRLPGVNAFRKIAFIFGLIAILTVVLRNSKKTYHQLPAILGIIVCGLFITHQSFGLMSNSKPLTQDTYVRAQEKSYNSLVSIQRLTRDLPKDSIVLSSIDDGYQIPAVSALHVIAIGEGNATPAADTARRTVCHQKLLESIDQRLLRQVGVSYVVARNGSDFKDKVRAEADNFVFVKKNKHHTVYRVTGSSSPASDIECSFRE